MTHVLFSLNSDRFTITNTVGCLELHNNSPILVRPGQPCIIPLGLFVRPRTKMGLLLHGTAHPKIKVHSGIIDPGYMGEVKAILFNTTEYNLTIRPTEMSLKVSCFMYSSELLPEKFKDTLSEPKYQMDVGRDVYLKFDMLLFPYNTFHTAINIPVPKMPGFMPVFFGRSGLATKGVYVCPNKWRQPYSRLEITNYTQDPIFLKAGDRFCQVVFASKENLPSRFSIANDAEKIDSKLRFQRTPVLFLEDPCLEAGVSSAPVQEQETVPVRGGQGFGSSGQ